MSLQPVYIGIFRLNPGVCPNKRYTADQCARIRFVSCVDDSDCAMNEKCCSNGCGPQCMAPATVNPGVCPGRRYTADQCSRISFVSCADDSDCAMNEKCCSNGCGFQCIAPATVNPGECPSMRYSADQCSRISFVSCADDSNCAKNEICCTNGCGLQCMAPAPAPVNPGVCPNKRYTADQCARIRFVSCVDDSNCAMNEKCCSNGCGPQCMAPAIVNPGVCPGRRYTADQCAQIRFVSCADDSDCANNEKCCSNGCGSQCIAPATVNPGVCPSSLYSADQCARISFVSCADDSNCAKNEICCSNGCGLQCLAPAPAPVNPGVCPNKRYSADECARIRLVSCVVDGDCANNEKCCSNGCGPQCMAPAIVNPGECPSMRYSADQCSRISFVSCADDSDCAKTEKCCSNGCGPQCMAPAPAPVNLRVCPSSLYTADQCSRISFVPCADDSNCAKNDICCSNGCGLQCMAPAPAQAPVVTIYKAEHPGVCPSRLYPAKDCAWIRFVSCADDSDCAMNEKCCSNGCGSQCMAPAPATVNPGVCPIKRYSADECEQIRFVPCADDSNCAKNEKCCSNGCGLQCMAPAIVNPGVCPIKRYTAEQCAWIKFVSCADDGDCAKNEKCCSNGCGTQCIAPATAENPGVCPSRLYSAEECARISFVSCVDDSNCAKNEKCCSNGCGPQCMAPAIAEHPGVCPSSRYSADECAWISFVTCADDSDCAMNEKCCSNGCGPQCMAPVTVNPGVCPSRRYSAEECVRIRFVPCVDDSDCAKNEKCCGNGCGFQCMAPVTVKPGVCPIKRYTAEECERIRFVPCADDSKCAKNEKCCSNGCGLQCMVPIPDYFLLQFIMKKHCPPQIHGGKAPVYVHN
ncbi:prestalk protein-like [Pseudorasbora parva]|uniref:prestalk protein-like n=1 Tax=Pseudorasbora parva TaxID=51549 RepID=UPI00351EA507